MHNNVHYQIVCVLDLLMVVLVGTLALLSASVPAQAQSDGVFRVNVGTDAPDANLADNICDADPGPAQSCTLRAAIMQSNAMPGSNGIDVLAGTVRLTIQGANEDTGRTGDLDITDALTISVSSGNDTPFTIDATGLGDRAIDTRSLIIPTGYPTEIELRMMVLKGGRADRFGGGIRVGPYSRVVIKDFSRIEGNTAGEAGGGLYVMPNGRALLYDTVITGNRTLNSSIHGGGGGIYSQGGVTLERSVVSANRTAAKGGGIFARYVLGTDRVAIINNTADDDGGGVYYTNHLGLYMWDTTVSGNRAKVDIAQHIYSRGGGIAIIGDNSPFNTIVGEVTIANNSAFLGGGLYAENIDLRRFENTIVANNTLSNCTFGANVNADSVSSSLVSDQSCPFPAAHNMLNTDPRLGPLDMRQWAPGHAPFPGSPALDAVPDWACHASADQHGRMRPVDGNADGSARCDIGAVEAMPKDWEPTPTPAPPMPKPTEITE